MESKNAPAQRKTPKAGSDYPRNYAEFMAFSSRGSWADTGIQIGRAAPSALPPSVQRIASLAKLGGRWYRK